MSQDRSPKAEPERVDSLGFPVGTAEPVGSQWAALVERIQAGDPSGVEELYKLFERGVRFYFCRRFGTTDVDDKVHDSFVIVLEAIKRGELREPERLMGFVRTVIRRQAAAYIESVVQERRTEAELTEVLPIPDQAPSPEEQVIAREKIEIMKQVLREVSPRDREILTRFYLLGQSPQQICAEMNLTHTQFRLLKSRAKARFGELGKRRLARSALMRLFMRAKGGSGH